MQTQVMFYLLNDNISQQSEIDSCSALYHACLQASHFYRQNQRVYIYANDKHSGEYK